jgi:hypothetical protein
MEAYWYELSALAIREPLYECGYSISTTFCGATRPTSSGVREAIWTASANGRYPSADCESSSELVADELRSGLELAFELKAWDLM